MAPQLTVIGVGHVFRISDAVRDAIIALQPDVVFIELDPGRYKAMLAKRAGKGPEIKGYVHGKLAQFQEGVAKMHGAELGEEMLAAVEGARAVGATPKLIDPPAQNTLRRALKSLTWREKFRAAGMMVKGSVKQILPSKNKKNARAELEAELARYQNDPNAAMEKLKEDFPTVYEIVIAERDAIMARRIDLGMQSFSRGVVVVGDGHVNGMLERLQTKPDKVYRLADVREGRLPKLPTDNSVAHTSFEIG